MNDQYSNPQYSNYPSAYQNTYQYSSTPQNQSTNYAQQQQPTWRAGPAPSYLRAHADEPAPKRARIDNTTPPGQGITLQHQSNVGYKPRYSGQTGGLALPPLPVSQAQEVIPEQTQSPSQPRRSGDTRREQVGQTNGQVSAQLEEQVRSLAHHEHASTDAQSSATGSSQHWRAHRGLNLDQYYEANHEETPSVRPFQRQPGAKAGNALNLACQACTRKKMKCSRNFPCTECTNSNEECQPSVKKRKGPQTDQERLEKQSQKSRDQPSGKGYKVDNPNRKFMLNLPQVIGTHQNWNNKTLKYNPIPVDIDAFRERIYKLEQPMLITSQQYADYWPHISNIYGRSINVTTEANGMSNERVRRFSAIRANGKLLKPPLRPSMPSHFLRLC